MSSASDFNIKDGVLTEYTGPGGDVVIPAGVTSIGDKAFAWCSSLKSVEIPKGVTSIGKGAFFGCSSLEIVLPEGMNIADEAFSENPDPWWD